MSNLKIDDILFKCENDIWEWVKDNNEVARPNLEYIEDCILQLRLLSQNLSNGMYYMVDKFEIRSMMKEACPKQKCVNTKQQYIDRNTIDKIVDSMLEEYSSYN